MNRHARALAAGTLGLVVGVAFPALSAAQTSSAGGTATTTCEPREEAPKPPERGVIGFLWGRAPRNGVAYLPIGLHSDSLEVELFHVGGFVYRSVYFGGFRNSFGDPTWTLGLERELGEIGPLHVSYRIGIMVGYAGNLVGSRGVPWSHSFLFKHNVSPIFAFPLQFDLARHVQLEVLANPFITAFGLKFTPRP